MQFRDLKTQYQRLKPQMDQAVTEVMTAANFISGNQVKELEQELAEYVGVKHCVTCGSGTDALTLALKALNIGAGRCGFCSGFYFFCVGRDTGSGRSHTGFRGRGKGNL